MPRRRVQGALPCPVGNLPQRAPSFALQECRRGYAPSAGQRDRRTRPCRDQVSTGSVLLEPGGIHRHRMPIQTCATDSHPDRSGPVFRRGGDEAAVEADHGGVVGGIGDGRRWLPTSGPRHAGHATSCKPVREWRRSVETLRGVVEVVCVGGVEPILSSSAASRSAIALVSRSQGGCQSRLTVDTAVGTLLLVQVWWPFPSLKQSTGAVEL